MARLAVEQAGVWVIVTEDGDGVAGGYQDSLQGSVDAVSFPAAPILVCRARALVGARRCLRSVMVSGIELPAGVSHLGVHTA